MPKTTVRIKLTLDEKTNEIFTSFENGGLQTLFNKKDADDFLKLGRLGEQQKLSLQNTNDRKVHKKPLKALQRVRTDDYSGEPNYAHAGIHLTFKDDDEIEWYTDQDFNFVVDVAPDPELYNLQRELKANELLSKADLHDKATAWHNPFNKNFPDICTKDHPFNSGPLKKDKEVKDQRYYKFNVVMLGTQITLDPHFEGHDD